MANIPTISMSPEIAMHIGSMPLSNANLATMAATLILGISIIAFRQRISVIPGRMQVIMEGLLMFYYNGLVSAYGSESRAKRQLPLILGLFLFILVCNQFTIIPLTQSIVLGDTPLFRAPTSHFSLTVAFALIVVIVSHVIAFTTSPLRHIGNFIKLHLFFKVRSFKDLANALLENFLSILDIIGEFAKIISLSARLFGNVFAGEVMVAVISGLSVYTQFIVPVPFYVLSVFSGFIQALVFSILAMSFISGMAKSVE